MSEIIRKTEGEKLKHQWVMVEDALRWAHRWAHKSLIKSPSVQRSSRSSDPHALTQLDNVAQATMILAFVQRSLPEIDRDVISLFFIPPGDARKEFLAAYVGHRLHEQLNRPKWWVVDVLRDWSGARAHHQVKWWCENLGQSQPTLWRWARGRDDRSVYTTIERDLAKAIDSLHEPMVERKWIGEEKS